MVSTFSLLFDHWLLPPLSFIVILASLALTAIFDFAQKQKYLTQLYHLLIYSGIVILLSFPAINRSVYMARNQSLDDARNLASHWMNENLPPGSTVLIDRYGPFLPQEHHNVIYQNSILVKDMAQYQAEGVDYMVGNSLNFANLIQARSDPTKKVSIEQQLLRANIILTQLSPEKEFVGGFGLSVRIYKIP